MTANVRVLALALLALPLPGCLAPDEGPAAASAPDVAPAPFHAEGVLWPTRPAEFSIPFAVNASGMKVSAQVQAGTRILVDLPSWVDVRVELRDAPGTVVDEARLRIDHGYAATLEHVATEAGEHALVIFFEGGGDGRGHGDHVSYVLDAR